MPVPVRTPKELGLAIRERRKALGLGQGELAARAGVSRQWIVGLERGKARAALGLVMRTCNALGLVLSTEAPDETRPRDDALPVIDISAVIEAARGRK